MKGKAIKWIILALVILAIIVGIIVACTGTKNKTELKSVKSEKELERIYGDLQYEEEVQKEKILKIFGAPFYVLSGEIFSGIRYRRIL